MDVRGLMSRAGLGHAVLLFALLTGLFAMHGLAANHDTAALMLHEVANGHAVVMPSPTTMEPGAEAGSPAALEHRALEVEAFAGEVMARVVATDAQPASSASASVAKRASGEDGGRGAAHASMETCLAVLGVGALLLLLSFPRSTLWSRWVFDASSQRLLIAAKEQRTFCLSLDQLSLSRT